jgi:hypothetical protein
MKIKEKHKKSCTFIGHFDKSFGLFALQGETKFRHFLKMFGHFGKRFGSMANMQRLVRPKGASREPGLLMAQYGGFNAQQIFALDVSSWKY